MKKILLLLLSFLYCSNFFACSCIGPMSFCETVSAFETEAYTFYVLDGVVSKKESDGMKVKIQSVLKGDFTEEEIFIRSGNGADCGHSTDGFSKDENYVFLLFQPYQGKYDLSICHPSFMKIENGIVEGPITPDLNSIPYAELGTLESCGDTPFNLFSVKNSLSLFPNPTIDEIRIKNTSESESNSTMRLEIIDVIGQDIGFYQKEEGILAGEIWIVNVSQLTAGVYFLRIISNKQEEVFRIVKQ